ncbi:pilus assembly protein PilM [Candidatus Poribacteria bacterium]|nr:pilus assembly protein PilM [Candidatus Poribacteria bacterium]MBT7095947.1 pilus assembly protein PilM [Candidatus Poribacteria bacterium]MBT7805992.1 pilus assembly protein PilM [Candidatus Poribacteria bacterium]
MAKNRIAAVDIGSHAVKVAVIAPAGQGWRVDSVASVVTSQQADAEERAAAVKRALAEAGARSAKCVIGLPRLQTVVRRLHDLPPGLDDASLRDIIGLQAESELPFDPGTAFYDYHDARETEAGTSVELVAARTADVEALIAPVREAGGKPMGVMPGVVGLGAMAAAQGLGSGKGSALLILDIGHTSTDAALVRDGAVVYTRSFPLGAAAFAVDADDAASRLVTETERSVSAIQRDSEIATSPTTMPFSAVWLTGGGAATALPASEGGPESLSELLQGRLGVPVSVDVRAGTIEDGAGLGSMDRGWERYALSIGLGIAALAGEMTVNLMPTRERLRHEQSAQTRVLLAYGAAAALLIAAFTFLSSQISAHGSRELLDLDRQIGALGPSGKRTSAKLSDMRAMTEMLEPKHSVIDVLRELTEQLPNRQDIAVTTLNIESTGKVTVSFEARSADAMGTAVRNMGSSRWFENVRPGQVTSAEKDGQPIQQFAVTLDLTGDADLLAARRVAAPEGDPNAVSDEAAPGETDEGGDVASANGRGPGRRAGSGGGSDRGRGGARGPGGGSSESGFNDGGSRRSGASGGRQEFRTADGGSKVIEGGRVTLYSASGSVIKEYDASLEEGASKDEAAADADDGEDKGGGVFVADGDATDERKTDDADDTVRSDTTEVRVRRVQVDGDDSDEK